MLAQAIYELIRTESQIGMSHSKKNHCFYFAVQASTIETINTRAFLIQLRIETEARQIHKKKDTKVFFFCKLSTQNWVVRKKWVSWIDKRCCNKTKKKIQGLKNNNQSTKLYPNSISIGKTLCCTVSFIVRFQDPQKVQAFRDPCPSRFLNRILLKHCLKTK